MSELSEATVVENIVIEASISDAVEVPTVTVQAGTTTTGAAGTSASVVNSGTLTNAVFDFTIPKGDTGETGATGATGATGPGVAAGGTAGQVLAKKSGTDYDTEWVDQSGGGSATWGEIDGTLSNQTDLQSALNAKQDALTAGTGISIASNVISATPELFWCTYGTTTYAEIQDAVAAGKIPALLYGGSIYLYVGVLYNTIYMCSQNRWTIKYVTVSTASRWMISTVTLLTTSNVQTIAAVNTFAVSPIVPTPTADMQASTKKYVDDGLADKQDAITSSTDLAVNSLKSAQLLDSTGDHLLAEYSDSTDEWYLGNSDAPINATVAEAFYVPQVDASGAGDQAATKQYVDDSAEFYWCTYGTTTYAQIAAAVTAGKCPVVLYDGAVFVLGKTTSSAYLFSSNTTNVAKYLQVNSSNVWNWDSWVNLLGPTAQTISGVKTFSATPLITNAPTLDNHAVNKAYVDGQKVTRSNTIAVADWSNGVATVAITGLRVDSDPSQGTLVLGFTDAAAWIAAKPTLRCENAGYLTITCNGTVPTSAVTVVVTMWEQSVVAES